jgi:thioredoxin 2
MSTKLERPTVQVCPTCHAKNRIPTAADGVPRCGRCHQALPWIVDAADETFAAVVEDATIPVLLDVWAPWCGPCRMVSPALEQLAGELAGRVKLVKVNADESPQVSGRFEVQAIPTLLLLRGGEVLAAQVGAAPAAQLKAWLTEKLEATRS